MRLIIVLNSNKEMSNYNFGFGFGSFGDLGFFFLCVCLSVSYFWVEISLLWDLAVLPDVCSFRADLQHRERVVFELSDNC